MLAMAWPGRDLRRRPRSPSPPPPALDALAWSNARAHVKIATAEKRRGPRKGYEGEGLL
ncbi:MAG: hypothetical protein M5U07_00980 [Xanthobacteraceae bacterium]|nr:hypothetical protein [Xanthobacteraceae bacterium]